MQAIHVSNDLSHAAHVEAASDVYYSLCTMSLPLQLRGMLSMQETPHRHLYAKLHSVSVLCKLGDKLVQQEVYLQGQCHCCELLLAKTAREVLVQSSLSYLCHRRM